MSTTSEKNCGNLKNSYATDNIVYQPVHNNSTQQFASVRINLRRYIAAT